MNENVPKWLIPGRVYDVLKWVGLEEYMERRYDKRIGESYAAVEKTNFYDAVYSPVVLTLNAAGTAIGAVIGASAISAWKGGADD